jgi:hypothetical protein
MSMGIRPGFPIQGDGYQADVSASGRHLKLFAEVALLGYDAVVFDANTNTRVAKESADNLDDAKQKAAQLAAAYLRHQDAEIPHVKWELNPQSRRPATP